MISAKCMQRLQSDMEKNALNQGQASGLKASIIKCPVVRGQAWAGNCGRPPGYRCSNPLSLTK